MRMSHGASGRLCNPRGELKFRVWNVFWEGNLTPDPHTTLEIRPHQPTTPSSGRP